MTLAIEFYAGARELAGVSRVDIAVPAESRVGILRNVLSQRFERLAPLLAKSAFAINEVRADDATVLQAGDTVAVLPPVSGG